MNIPMENKEDSITIIKPGYNIKVEINLSDYATPEEAWCELYKKAIEAIKLECPDD